METGTGIGTGAVTWVRREGIPNRRLGGGEERAWGCALGRRYVKGGRGQGNEMKFFGFFIFFQKNTKKLKAIQKSPEKFQKFQKRGGKADGDTRNA